MSDRRKAPARARTRPVRRAPEEPEATCSRPEVLFLETLRPLAGESPSEFAERGLRDIKRSLAQRILDGGWRL